MQPAHKAFSRGGTQGKTAVLFVHGIFGSPDQFDFLIEALPETIAVENLLLPGHGGSIADFRKSTYPDWQNHVHDVLEKLLQEYENVYLVGHSMGCLLLLAAQTQCAQNAKGQLWIAPPFRMRLTWRCIVNNARLLFSQTDANEIIAAARRGNSITASNPLAYLGSLPHFAALLAESVRGKKHLPRLAAPVIAVYAENDEIVSPGALNCLRGLPLVKIFRFRGASHYYFSDKGKKALVRLFSNMLAGKS